MTTAANDALTLNITVPACVGASAHDGSVTLTGTVNCGSQRDATERAVARLTGVPSITDEIEISWDADPLDVTVALRDDRSVHPYPRRFPRDPGQFPGLISPTAPKAPGRGG